jgi:hypothetical protein
MFYVSIVHCAKRTRSGLLLVGALRGVQTTMDSHLQFVGALRGTANDEAWFPRRIKEQKGQNKSFMLLSLPSSDFWFLLCSNPKSSRNELAFLPSVPYTCHTIIVFLYCRKEVHLWRDF